MPLTAAMMQADLAAIAGDIPGAVSSVVIGGTTFSAIGGAATSTNEQAASGDHQTADGVWLISAAAIDAAGVSIVPGTTEAAVGATTYLIVSSRLDAIGAAYLLTYVEETRP